MWSPFPPSLPTFCLRWQIAVKGRHTSSPISPFSQALWFVPYFLRNTVVFLQTSWGRQKPTRNTFLWCYSSCLHPPMESLLKRSSFLPFLSLCKISTSVLPSNKKTWKEMEQVSSSFPKMCFKLQTFSLSQCPWHLFMEGWYLPLPLGSIVVPLTMNWATLQYFIGLLQEGDNTTER